MENIKIKEFAQKTLGCTCTENVFAKIETNNVAYENLNGRRILIGDRLLIYMWAIIIYLWMK
jgi:hypothetical protein